MGEPKKPNFYDFGIFGACPDPPKPIILIFGDTRILKKNQEIHGTFSKNIIAINIKMLGTQCFANFSKDGRRTMMKIH